MALITANGQLPAAFLGPLGINKPATSTTFLGFDIWWIKILFIKVYYLPLPSIFHKS
jgi:hypothetical protein